jgi:hypothetical protein
VCIRYPIFEDGIDIVDTPISIESITPLENSKFKGVNFEKFCARVVNLVTYDVVDDQKLIFKV